MTFRQMASAAVMMTFICTAALADPLTTEKRADIEKLLSMTNALALSKQMATATVGSMMNSLKKARPDIPEKVLNMLPAEVEAVFEENMGSFKEAMIPIYDKHFTDPELKELIRFYSTPLGTKLIATMPALMQDGMIAGQRWGMGLAPKINQRISAKLKQEGVKI